MLAPKDKYPHLQKQGIISYREGNGKGMRFSVNKVCRFVNRIRLFERSFRFYFISHNKLFIYLAG